MGLFLLLGCGIVVVTGVIALLIACFVKETSPFFSCLAYLMTVTFLIAFPVVSKVGGAATLAILAPLALPAIVISSLWSPFIVWTLLTCALVAISILVLFRVGPVSKAVLPLLLGVITASIPAITQNSWTAWQMNRTAPLAGLTCIVVQPLSTSITEGLFVDGVKRHFHAVAFKAGLPWNWSYRAKGWQQIPQSNPMVAELIADHIRSECPDR